MKDIKEGDIVGGRVRHTALVYGFS